MSSPRNTGRGDGRDSKGQFTRSGNLKGRPRKPDPSLSTARRKAIAKVADRKVSVRVTGERAGQDVVTEMSVFEACVYRLGVIGAQGNRLAAKDFVQLAMHNSLMTEARARTDEALARRSSDPRSRLLDEQLAAIIRRREEFEARLDAMYPDDREEEAADDEDGRDPLDE